MGIVWIASYPKSGSTWLRLALQALQRPGEPLDINDPEKRPGIASLRRVFDDALSIESSDLTDLEIVNARPDAYRRVANEATVPLLLKVHDAWIRTPSGQPLFPPSATTGVAYLVRDPRDVAVSFAHHFSCPTDTAIERMSDMNFTLSGPEGFVKLQLPQRVLSWSAHVESWLSAPDTTVLLVRYEDMIVDMAGVLTQVARLAGLPAGPVEVRRAVDAVQFSRLRVQEDASGFDERMPGAYRFFRRGAAGEWLHELTSAQVEAIESDHGPIMDRLGYSRGHARDKTR